MTDSRPVTLTDPKAIRALAHPARLAVIEELYDGGKALTATECAAIAGLTPSAMSYHLRSLERAGIVERADAAADGRERPWRAAGTHVNVESDSFTAETAALSTLLLSRLGEQFTSWLGRRERESQQWRDAALATNTRVWLTAEELTELWQGLEAKLREFRVREDRPADARRVRLSVFAFPTGDVP